MFLFSPKTNRSKRKVFIWFTYYRNERKTFWFCKKKVFSQADRFRIGSKTLGPNKAVWFVLEVVLGKLERLYLIQKLTDQSKTFWFGLLIIGQITQKISQRCNELSLLVYLKVWKEGLLKAILLIPRLTDAGNSFSITNISANSKPKSKRLKKLCKEPLLHRFMKKKNW
jgi:hypothetical protein